MKNYFAYIRVSTTKQGEHGSSLQEQRSAIEAYAARNQLHISTWFEEQETAAKQGRKEFARLTSLLRQGKAAGVIIHKIDRSARNLKDWAGLGDLIDGGIEVLFAHEGLDMQTRGGRLAADIQAVVAADFIRNLRDEVRKGFYGRLKQGFYPLPAPRGYLDRGKARAKEICPTVGPLVALAFELYATGTRSLDGLRRELAAKGLVGSTGRPLSLEAISSMLRNPFYAGRIRILRTGENFEGKHTPLVAKKVFDEVQAIMDGRLYPRIERHVFPFRRLVHCAACGRSLTGERQKGHVYYRCHDRPCAGVSVSETVLDAAVLEALDPLVLREVDVGDLRDMLQEEIEQEEEAKAGRILELERELPLIEHRLARLTDAYLDGTLDKQMFESRKVGLFDQRSIIQDQLQGREKLTFWPSVAEWFELGLTAYSGYKNGNPDRKRQLVEMIFSNLIVDRKTPAIRLKFPFCEIAEWARQRHGGPYPGAVRTLRPGLARRRQAPVSALLDRLARQETAARARDTEISPSSPPSPKSPKNSRLPSRSPRAGNKRAPRVKPPAEF